MIRGTGIKAQSHLNARTGGIKAVITGSTREPNWPQIKPICTRVEVKHTQKGRADLQEEETC